MRKIRFLMLALFLFSGGCASAHKPDLKDQIRHAELESFKENERILILAPHPDDESIACAGIIQKALKAGAQVRIVYLTNGDHNEFAFIVYEKRIVMRQGEFIYMGKLRQKESIKAMKFLGLSEKDLVFLGYPDYGTFEIFCKYWQTNKPFRDRLTRISSVPYKDNLSYGAAYVGENILADLTKQIMDYQPDKIFVSHPADVNVDHKSLYLFLQVALSDLEARMARPEIYPYFVHCAGWPKPRHYHPELELYPPDKFNGSPINWLRSDLSAEELVKKYRAILFYKSQTQTSAFYLFSFARKNELFSDYPELKLDFQSTSEGREIIYSDASEMFREEEALKEEELLDSKQIVPPGDKGSVGYAVEGNYFIVRLGKTKKFSSRFGVMLYIFGYSKNTPFAQMPKIRIIIMGRKCQVFSSKNRVINSGVLLNFDKKSLIFKIPLKLLGQPDYTLMALKAYRGNLPIDAVVFRKVRITQDPLLTKDSAKER